jgi:DNA-binding IclR family transcriptional regulator
MASPKYSLLTLRKGLAVLELIAENGGDIGLTEISAQLEEPVTVVFRVLKTLSELGYVTQHPTSKRYRLGLKIWELSEKAIARLDIVAAAQPVLARLTQRTAETSSLAIMQGKEFLYVASVNGSQPLRAYVLPGSRTPLTFPTASGRILLANSKPEFVDEVLAEGLKRFTPATVTSVDRVRGILKDVRNAGVAVVHGEYQHQLSAVAVPILNAVGDCVAALALSGLTQRFEGKALPDLIRAAKAEAANLSNLLQGGAFISEPLRSARPAGRGPKV